MEVRIRLQKAGKTANKHYNYRIVAINRTASRQADNLEILGYYDPSKKPASISINREKLNQWVNKGAVMSDTVRSLIKKVKS
ncbi:MAG: 30S ribosomal protein S16 [Omnitrophica WOR_2 bacterium RIFCSPHIGHO2_01_FULL_48_9]|nr:MAG: 30S ribosomal protein S16 [Omnitrophica WOR_2 bacterium RIFCSPHIGHO2_02_FULL_48_11]OGX33913.1 MAG: 30S ribosomal protein S16 [Omnitrophica WOR_2 bacterium RIFCSPHIGHO2_01_FULL_48_9]